MTNKLKDILIIVTGTGYKEAKRIFHDGETCELIEINGMKYKINVGAATAKAIAKIGGRVCMVSRTEEKLRNLRKYISNKTGCGKNNILYYVVDLLDEQSVKEFVSALSKERPIWLVHSIGLGAQAYKVRDDNPYLAITQTLPEMPTKEFETVVKSLLILAQNLLPIFKQQKETRIVVVSSMSGIRPYMYGYSHASAKAGIHHAIRSLALELNYLYRSIYVTEILPGIVDTGLYDSESVIKSVGDIGETFGFYGEKRYSEKNFPLTPPSAAADSIVLALQSSAHILSINMVAQGQFPNMGA